MLQWILEQAVIRNDSDMSVIKRVLITNFAAIDTTATVRIAQAVHQFNHSRSVLH